MDSDSEGDILGELMSRDEGARRFVANCFLLLSPEELKACRLVSTTWAGFILEDLWKSSWGRRELTEKLVTRWTTVDPMTVELKRGMQRLVSSIFSTDAHVFCGFYQHGKIAVYDLSTGLLFKELTPDKRRLNYIPCTQLAGGDGIVAAAMWETVVTVWSTRPSV